ncbi:MAG: ferrochelatase [Bacteroidota bacterium]
MEQSGKKGVLLVNLGTPDSPTRKDVYRYLKEFLLDPRVIDIPWLPRNLLVRGIIAPFRSGESAKLYKKLWTPEGSPLKVFGYAVQEGVQEILGEDYVVELAMRYQNPSIKEVILSMLEKRISQLAVIPLFPQYASATTGSVHEEVMRVLSQEAEILPVHFVNSYYDYEPMIDVFVQRAKQYDMESFDHILFSYHGIPQRQLIKPDRCNHCMQTEGCCETISPANQFCYGAHCHATTKAIVEKLGLEKSQYTLCYQSRLGKTPWMQPYTSEVIEHLAEKGAKRLLVFCPAFVSDCLETTLEISEEYQEEFEEYGGELVQLVEGLNDHPGWIAAVAQLARESSEAIVVTPA